MLLYISLKYHPILGRNYLDEKQIFSKISTPAILLHNTYISRRLRYKKSTQIFRALLVLWWSGLGISIVVMWYATFVAGWSIMAPHGAASTCFCFLHMLRRWANCRAVNSHLINCSITFTVNKWNIQTQHLARNVQLCTAFANEPTNE